MPRATGAFGRSDGKGDSETRAAALARLANHRPAVSFDDVACDGEAEARPLPFRREEGGEHSRTNLLRDATTTVVDVDDDTHAFGGNADFDGTAARHGFARVAEQAEERLPELRLVEQRRGQPVGDVHGNCAPGRLNLSAREL